MRWKLRNLEIPGVFFAGQITEAVVLILVMAAFGWGQAGVVLEKSGGIIVSILGATLGPWLAYKGWKLYQQKGNGQ